MTYVVFAKMDQVFSLKKKEQHFKNTGKIEEKNTGKVREFCQSEKSVNHGLIMNGTNKSLVRFYTATEIG